MRKADEHDPDWKSSAMNKIKAVRLHRYRQRHRRLDYYPSPDVADIIAHHQSVGREKCLAGILDGLIRAGHKFVSGNGGGR
jgi:hypothetical protein